MRRRGKAKAKRKEEAIKGEELKKEQEEADAKFLAAGGDRGGINQFNAVCGPLTAFHDN